MMLMSPRVLFQNCVFTLALTGLVLGAPIAAQDTLPDTKGELKDFRLDDPPKEKADEPAPKVEAPVVQPEVKTVAPPAKPAQKPAAQKQPAKAETQTLPAAEATPDPLNESTDGLTDVQPAPTPVINEPTEPEVTATPSSPPAFAEYIKYWPIAAGALLALLALAFYWGRRGRRPQPIAAIAETAAPELTAPVRRTPARPIPAEPTPPVLASITARFDPGDARLSVANLTVKGHLHLRYEGAAPLETLKLRTRVMSACDGQKALIDAFHSDPMAGQIESLGPVVPGEEINLTLEMQVPRDALQAFDWRERRFVAPIVLINVASDDGTTLPCRVSCVVGQPSGAGSERLQPIPIDRGPKLFDALQFRPIAA